MDYLEKQMGMIKPCIEISRISVLHVQISSSFLVQDKQLLSKWISGVQQGFATLYIQTKRLNVDAKELELLKEFFAY